MHVKSAPVMIKAAGEQDGTDSGVFEAIVSAFGNVDSYGDVVVPGAFTDTLAEWAAKGDPIPVVWTHASQDPDYHIGWVLEAEERPEGLWVRAQLDPDDLSDIRSKTSKVYRLLKGRRVTQFSFAFDILDGGWGERDGQDVYELRKLKVYEVGPTLVGVNQNTELLDIKGRKEKPVKTTDAKPVATAGKSGGGGELGDDAKQPPFTAIVDAIAELKSLITGHTQDDKATPTPPADVEEPPVKAIPDAAPSGSGTASARLRADIASLEADVLTLTN